MDTSYMTFGRARDYRGYLAQPPGSASLPAVVVYQEAWGVDDHIEEVVRRIAAAGYVALAPDLFAEAGQRPPALSRCALHELQDLVNRLPPGAMSDPARMESAITARAPEQAARLRQTRALMMASLAAERHLPQALAAVGYLAEALPRCRNQPLFALGFCMGGSLVALSAVHDARLRGAAMFYGSPPPQALIPQLHCPLLAFHGDSDQRLAAGVPALREQMTQADKSYEVHLYPQAGHAFFNDRRPSYEPTAARHAFARTLAFLDQHSS